MATSFLTRLRGLLGTGSLPEGEALYLSPCNQIHMFWMRYAIDAVFLDADLNVVAVVDAIGPWRVSPHIRTARSCLELPAGAAGAAGIVIGDSLELRDL